MSKEAWGHEPPEFRADVGRWLEERGVAFVYDFIGDANFVASNPGVLRALVAELIPDPGEAVPWDKGEDTQ